MMTKTKQRVVRQGRTEVEKAVSRGRNLLIEAGHGDYWKHVLANGAPHIDASDMADLRMCVLGRTFAHNTDMEDGFSYGCQHLAEFASGAGREGFDPEINASYYGFDGYDYNALADAWVAQALRDKVRAAGWRTR